jgi:hypothetical protein
MDSHWLGTITLTLLRILVFAKLPLDKPTARTIRRKENLAWHSLAIAWKDR